MDERDLDGFVFDPDRAYFSEPGDPFSRIRTVTSPLAPPGTMFIIDMGALELPKVKASDLFAESYPVAVSDTYYLRAGMEITYRGHTKIERDPMEMYGLPRSVRQWWRLARKLVGYEYRKAAGKLRRIPERRHAVIVGLTA